MRTSQTPLLGSAALRLVLNAHVADSFFNTHLADLFARFASLHWRARLRCAPPSVECARRRLLTRSTPIRASDCCARPRLIGCAPLRHSAEHAPGRLFPLGKLMASAATLCVAWCEG